MTDREKEWADKMRRFIKAELKRAGITYAELAHRLNEHGLEGETEASVNSKLVRGTFPATWLMAVLAVLGIAALMVAEL
jgi:lambda repressor-like predicted transcriptional regulator